MAFEIICAKLISSESRKLALQMFWKWMGINAEFSNSYLIKNTIQQVEFYLPKINQENVPILSFQKNIWESKEVEGGKHILTTPFNITTGIYSYYLYLLSVWLFAKNVPNLSDKDADMEFDPKEKPKQMNEYLEQLVRDLTNAYSRSQRMFGERVSPGPANQRSFLGLPCCWGQLLVKRHPLIHLSDYALSLSLSACFLRTRFMMSFAKDKRQLQTPRPYSLCPIKQHQRQTSEPKSS